MKHLEANFRLTPWLMATAFSVTLAACGGGGQDPILGSGGIAPVVVAPPTVTNVTPLPSATAISINTKALTAAFSQAMDPATLTPGSFTLACPASTAMTGGSVSYQANNNTATLTLPANTVLISNTVCVANITTAAKDTTGVAMADDFSWQFTTGSVADTTAPTVSSTVNANGASHVAINTKVGASFSEAMNPLTITNTSFTLKQTSSGADVAGDTSYSGVNAVFAPASVLAANTQYTATVTTAASDLAGNPLAADYSWSWTTATTADTTAPLVVLVNPVESAPGVAVTTSVNATFNEAMDPLTITTANFKVAGVTGTVSYNAQSKVATFTPNANLAAGTTYTATVSTAAADLAGNALTVDKVWEFTTVAIPVDVPLIALNSVAPFGTFGGTAGMTNMGTLTIINGDIGTIATTTSAITGFHDTAGDIYTETTLNKGAVNGKIYTCTNSVTGPNSTGPSAPDCDVATQARLDAQTAYLALVAKPVGGASPAPGANLAGITLQPGTYVAPSGPFLIEGGDLTLDAQGDANATWVFQMASTLTVGGPGAAAPQSIILAGGAQAKNVFWQVGSTATINAAGGGTMVGTIIAQAGVNISTADNMDIVALNGRALSLGASVTMVNTVINVPAQ